MTLSESVGFLLFPTEGSLLEPSVIIWLEGRVTPKARPRFGGGKAYLPQNYREWKKRAIAEAEKQFNGSTLQKVAIEIEFLGAHRGDLDNLAGAILDALVQAKIIKDDRLSCLSSLLILHQKSKIKGASVKIYALHDSPASDDGRMHSRNNPKRRQKTAESRRAKNGSN